MNSGLNGLPSHFSKPANLLGSTLTVGANGWSNIGTAGGNLSQQPAGSWTWSPQTYTAVYAGSTKTLEVLALTNQTSQPVAQTAHMGFYGTTSAGLNFWQAPLNNAFVGVATVRLSDQGVGFNGSSATINFSDGANLFASMSGNALGTFQNFSMAGSGTADTHFTRAAAATFQFGLADAAAPVAQTTQVQGVVAGTTNTAAVDWTLQGSRPTGTGLAGNIVVKTGFKGLSQNSTVTVTAATPAVVTYAAHGMVPGQSGQFTTTGTLPAGLSLATTYYVLSALLTAGSNSFQVSLTPGGTAINCSDTGTGTHTFTTNTTTQNPANTVMTIGPAALTGSQTIPALEITPAWNIPSATIPVALNINPLVVFGTNNGLTIRTQLNGTDKFSVDQTGLLVANGKGFFGGYAIPLAMVGSSATVPYMAQATGGYCWSSTSNLQLTPDLVLTRPAAATLQQGAADAATCVAQATRVQSIVAGTTDVAGTDWTRRASLSTGTAAGGNIIEQTGFSAKSTGSSQGTAVDRKILVAKGKVLTSGAAFSMFDVALPTLSMCGGQIDATIICTDGTDMQSFTQTVTYSAVNKAAAYTTSITPSTGDKSVSAGTLTTSWTIVSGTNKVTIKVTPTTSLTPSANSFLLYYTIKNNSEQATTIL